MTKEQELICYLDSVFLSQRCAKKEDYKGAAIHLQNAIRSLNELGRTKNLEEADRQINLILKQLEGNVDLKRMLRERVYGE